MVNFGLNSASLLGIVLALCGAGLFFLRSVRPELSRDYDIVFAVIGLICGSILLFQGWRLDPILAFGQFLLAGTSVFYAAESVRLRGSSTAQARRNSKIVDDDRPVSSRVRVEAELDQLEPYEDDYYDYDAEPNFEYRRLRGYDDPNTSRRSAYDDEADSRSTRSSRSRTSNRRSASSPDRRESSRPRSSATPSSRSRRPSTSRPQRPGYEDSYDAWSENDFDNDVDRRPPSSRPSRGSTPDAPRRRSRRPASSADYVDYQPLDPQDLGRSYQDDEGYNDEPYDNPSNSPEAPQDEHSDTAEDLKGSEY
ncbi:MAG: Ycf66 family protein [Cyanobacteria bacterium P01_H01_bin.15]